MMQRFTLLLLVASVALLGAVLPVDATRLVKRETNAQRFARHLTPLAPVRRSRTHAAKRSQPSNQPNPNAYTGTLQVKNQNGNLIGLVYDDAHGPTGVNLVSDTNHKDPNLEVTFSNGVITANGAHFIPPYLGAGTPVVYTTSDGQALNFFEFINVQAQNNNIWTLDTNSLQLTATLTNTDHTKVPLAIVFDSAHDTLYFTENPATITGSDSLALVTLSLQPTQ